MESKIRKTIVDWMNRYCLAQKGGEFTHTSLYDPMAAFYVPPDKTDKFFVLYKNAVKEGADLYMTKKHMDIGPVVIDLDFPNKKPYLDKYRVTHIYSPQRSFQAVHGARELHRGYVYIQRSSVRIMKVTHLGEQ